MTDSLEYKFVLTKQDILDGTRARFEREAAKLPSPSLANRVLLHAALTGVVLLSLVGAFMTLAVLSNGWSMRPKPLLFVVAGFAAVAITSPRLLLWRQKGKLRKSYLRRVQYGLGVGVVGPVTVRLDADGVHGRDRWSNTTYSWSLMQEPECDQKVFTMEVQGRGLLVIPRSALEEQGSVNELLELVAQRRAASGGLESVMRHFLEHTDAECPWCDYNLRNVKELRCPECGRAIGLLDL